MILPALTLMSLTGFSLGVSFSYLKNYEKEWDRFNPACAGKNQSPIQLNTANAIPLSIPALELDGYQNLLPTPITLKNNGHSVELRPEKFPAFDNTPQIFGAILASRYHLDSFHFHWGSRNSRGSEHVIDSVRFPMEMHIVHRNEKYTDVAEALNHRDGLVVLAFFIETRERTNHALDPILAQLWSVAEEGSSVNMTETFPLSTLLPSSTDIFYTYQGSLTTPPCSESVTWIVFPDPIAISFNQILKFRALKAGEHHHLEDNYRHLEPLNSRKIYVKREPADSSSFRNRNETFFDFTDPKNWI